jgi:hypothetical protein
MKIITGVLATILCVASAAAQDVELGRSKLKQMPAAVAASPTEEKPSPKFAKVNYFSHVSVGNALNVYDPTTGENVSCDADINTKEVSCGKHFYTGISITVPESEYPIHDGGICFIDKPLSRREAFKRAEQNECGGALENFAMHHKPPAIPDPKVIEWAAKNHRKLPGPSTMDCGEIHGAPAATCGKKVDADNTEYLVPYTLRTLRDKSVWVVLKVDDGEWGTHELWYPL